MTIEYLSIMPIESYKLIKYNMSEFDMNKQRAIELDEIAMTVVNDFIFKVGITNVERSYLTSKIQEFTTEKERSI